MEEDLIGDPGYGSKSKVETFLASLRAFTQHIDLIITGTRIHDDLEQRELLEECSHALVLMNVKCGKIGKAKELLDMHMSSSNVVTWTALLAGYAQDRHGQNDLDYFKQMQCKGILLNEVAYACIKSMCRNRSRWQEETNPWRNCKARVATERHCAGAML